MGRIREASVRVGRVAGLSVLAAEGAFFAIMGFHDAILATRREERLLGGALVAAGAALLGAVMLFTHRTQKWADRAVQALLTAGALGGLVLVSVQTGFESDYRNWIWWTLASIPVLAAVLLARSRRRAPTSLPSNRGGETGENKLEIVAAIVAASATIIGALLGLLGGAFRPVANPSILNVDVKVSIVAHRQDSAGMPVTVANTLIQLKNIGRERLVFFGSTYTVSAYMSTARPSGDEKDWPYSQELTNQGWSGRYEKPFGLHAIEVQNDLVQPGDFLEPGQSITINFLTPVPTSSFNTVSSGVLVATAYDDRLRLGDQREFASKQDISSGDGVESKWDIAPTSWLARLVRGQQELAVQYRLTREADPSGPSHEDQINGTSMDFQIGREKYQSRTNKTPITESSERVRNFYGGAWTAGHADTALDASN